MTTPIRSIAGLSGPLALGEDHDVSALADQTPLRLKMVKKIKKATLERKRRNRRRLHYCEGSGLMIIDVCWSLPLELRKVVSFA
jgi:hypothetical protein